MTQKTSANQEKPSHLIQANASSPEDERKYALVQAAFAVIAERGFEGLRTREVAKRAGVTVAMVHYYFRKKELLIHEVVNFIGGQYLTFHAPLVFEGKGTPLDHLRQEFADAKYYQENHPQLAIVYQELLLRSQRDPSIQPFIQNLEKHRWADIEKILQQGIEQKTFRSDLDMQVATNIIVSLLRGALYTTTKNFDYDKTYSEIVAWLGSSTR